jgi:hypothetical protein
MIESFSKAHENDNPPTPFKFKSAIQKNIKDFFASWKLDNKALSNRLRDIIAKSNSIATLQGNLSPSDDIEDQTSLESGIIGPH